MWVKITNVKCRMILNRFFFWKNVKFTEEICDLKQFIERGTRIFWTMRMDRFTFSSVCPKKKCKSLNGYWLENTRYHFHLPQPIHSFKIRLWLWLWSFKMQCAKTKHKIQKQNIFKYCSHPPIEFSQMMKTFLTPTKK